ncbi:MAG TPA: beta/gamma crystallin-related protein [Azospirillaceae bacterium]|nr:beta/gamma crystallin-related protein [Azospirillaceae bacterium]
MSRMRIAAVSLALPLLAAGSAAAGSITLYEGGGFQGQSVTVRGDVENFAHYHPWNDRARSLVVNSGTWEVCKHKNFKDCTILRGGARVQDLGAIGLFARISSVRQLDDHAWRDRDHDWRDRDWRDRDWRDRDRDRDWRDRDRRDWDRRDDWGRDPWGRDSRYDDPRYRDRTGWGTPPRGRDDVIWNDGPRGGGLSSCQQRVYNGLAQRFGYNARVSFSGAANEGAVNWNGEYWQFRCTNSEINIWQ